MKNNVYVIVIVSITAGLLAGLLAGYTTAKKKYQPEEGMIMINPANTLFFSPTATDNAHAMSARFRNAAGLCGDDASGGVFEFSDSTAYDIVASVDSIKREISRSSSPVPRYFRGIFGIDLSGRTRLIITGLTPTNREYALSAKIINGHLPCPLLCDLSISEIIMGIGTDKNPCR